METVIQPVETKVKFGFSQLFKETPETAKLAFRAVLYVVAILVFLVDTITEIPEPFKAIVRHYAIYTVAIVHFFSKLFGLEIKDVN